MKIKGAWKTVGWLAIALLALTEIGVRLSGLVDFPAYVVDDGIGYIVKPNQSGRFLDKNAWAFNARSMPTMDEWRTGRRPNIMVIGNSIIMGGNPLDQKDKLVPQLVDIMGPQYSIWPLAIGGWTNVNEMVYLDRNPDVLKATNFFVWEYMRGGLSGLSQWRGDYVFPTTRPVWATGYAMRRYVLARFLHLNFNELPPTGLAKADHFAEFETHIAELCRISGLRHPGILLFYPDLKDFTTARKSVEWLPERRALETIAAKYGLTVIDLTQSAVWNASLYRDGVHPTVQGNIVLARILAEAIQTTSGEMDVAYLRSHGLPAARPVAGIGLGSPESPASADQ